MKLSRYNYIIEQDNKTYWFNALTYNYFSLNRELSRKIEKSLKLDYDIIKNNSPIFFNKLLNNGFMINKNINELKVIRNNNRIAIEAKYYFLIILPTLNCNFACWYCVQDHIATKMDEATINKIKAHIKRSVEVDKIEHLHLEWFGGEPFMYFNEIIEPISEYAMSICKKNSIPFANTATTNGYFLSEDIHSKLLKFNFTHFQITLDGIREQHNKVKVSQEGKSAFDVTLNNINTLLSNSSEIHITLRINYTSDNLGIQIADEINEIIFPENRYKINLLIRKVWQENVDCSRSTKIKDLISKFMEYGYNISPFDIQMNFRSCYTDKKWYNAINYNGYIVKCTANNDLYRSKPLGELHDDGSIQWEDGFEEKYYKVRFENKHCLACKHLPLCMGRCGRDYNKEKEITFQCKANESDQNFEETIMNYIKSQENLKTKIEIQ